MSSPSPARTAAVVRRTSSVPSGSPERSARPQDAHVDEGADHGAGRGVVTAGDGQADSEVVGAGVVVEQGGPGGEEQHDGAGAVLRAAPVRAAVTPTGRAARTSAPRKVRGGGRSWPVQRDGVHGGHSVQPGPPVGGGRVEASGAGPLAFASCVRAVAQGQPGQAGLAAFLGGGAEFGQFGVDVEPGGGVVHRVVGREDHRPGPLPQVQEDGRTPLGCPARVERGAGQPGVQRAPFLGLCGVVVRAQLDQFDLRLGARVHLLAEPSVHGVQDGAQWFVAVHEDVEGVHEVMAGHGRVQGELVDRAVGGRVVGEPGGQPGAFLGVRRRCGDRSGGVVGGGGVVGCGPAVGDGGCWTRHDGPPSPSGRTWPDSRTGSPRTTAISLAPS